MEELYPGCAKHGSGFTVNGFAKTSPTIHPPPRPEPIGKVNVGFFPFGTRSLFVQQESQTSYPSFHFRPLTTKFLTNAIADENFEFSLIQKRIGDVGYISGAAAREFGGDVSQGIISLHAAGSWSLDGLRIRINGELGDNSALLNQPTPPKFKQASYGLEAEIPWGVLRFLFYDEMNFLLWNYKTYGPSHS